jgi:hypothetical protein
MVLEQRRERRRHLVSAVLAGDDEDTVVQCARQCSAYDGKRVAR